MSAFTDVLQPDDSVFKLASVLAEFFSGIGMPAELKPLHPGDERAGLWNVELWQSSTLIEFPEVWGWVNAGSPPLEARCWSPSLGVAIVGD